MKVAVMQPYLFAYIGYYQLINASDLYVSDDDVQYINKGWINRNRLLLKGEPLYFTFSVQKDAHTQKISQRVFCKDRHDYEKKKFLKTLDCYRRAPHYAAVFEVIRRIMSSEETNVARFVINSIQDVCRYLDIKTPIKILSKYTYDGALKGEARVLGICRRFQADEYINPIGGTELYSMEKFSRAGIKLSFLKTKDMTYPQFNHGFVPNLSIIDVLMFNPKEKVRELLMQYDLI